MTSQEAMDLAEAARQKRWQHPSFCKQLFMGSFAHEMLFPFPQQSEEEKQIGDQFIAELGEYLKKNLDPNEVDKTGMIPQNVIDKMVKMGVFAMKIPKEQGGLGFSQVNYNRVMMMIASHCASTAALVGVRLLHPLAISQLDLGPGRRRR